MLAGDYALGNDAFVRRNGDDLNPTHLSAAWEAAIEKKWDGMTPEARLHGYLRPHGIQLEDIRIWTLPEFQRLCRRNANAQENLVDEVTGCELTPDTWGVDRVVNGIVPGVSGEYRNSHTLITHPRLNDFKEVRISRISC